MNFLSPMAAIVAAAITIPALLLLYFLKLRRRYLRMPSTLLWERTVEDLEVNAPFQRLRFSSLLALQLLVLAALLFAFAEPVTEGDRRSEARLILMIDRSASMNAADAGDGRTRLEAAQDEARQMVSRLGRGGAASEVMIITFARSASVASSFEYDRRPLLDAIDVIEPTDEEANLQEALQLAAAFAGHGERPGDQAADIVLISDGNVGEPPDAVGFRLRVGTFSFVQVGPQPGEPIDNLGITAFSARRDLDDPARVLVFGQLANAGLEPVDAVVRLRVDGETAEIKRVTVPAADSSDRGSPPGEKPVTFAIDLPDGAVLELTHNHNDALASDDIARLVLPAPSPPRIALVHPEEGPDPFLRDLLGIMEPQSITPLTSDAFAALDERTIDTARDFDMVVFDRVAADRLPGIPSLTFGAAPRGVAAEEPARDGGRRILSWDRRHPMMRHLELDSILFAGFGRYELPEGASVLASGPEGPVMALVRRRGAGHVLVGFELRRSNWPMHVSIAVFMQNAVEHLMLAATGQVGLAYQPGDSITARAELDAEELRVDGPEQMRTAAEPGELRTLPRLVRSGLYTVDGAVPPMDRVAVSILSARETDIRPRRELVVNAEAREAGGSGRIVPRELWPWVLAAALVLLMFEWLTYLRRAAG